MEPQHTGAAVGLTRSHPARLQGAEPSWGGVLPHSLIPGRIYEELSQLGSSLEKIGNALDGYDPDADVAILWSNDSRFAMPFAPPVRRGGEAGVEADERIIDAFHRGVVDSGRQARILHVDQARGIGA